MICKKEDCTGCFACYNICPKNAINMKEDEYGYIYPEIDKYKCINCNLCKKVCPSVKLIKLFKSQKALAMWNNDNNIRKTSTSGGIATTLYKFILKKNGIIYGCSNSVEDKFPFVRIDKIQDLHKVQGSKYVHAYINDTYRKVKEDLEEKKDVMFIGTPCQVAGLKNFLQKEYRNLYTADIICHGVPSQKLLKDEILYKLGKIKNAKVTFRENGNFCIRVYESGNLVLDEMQDKNFYFLGFMKSLFYRENCYTCRYANSNRVGDLTLGDFWGIGKANSENKYEKEEKNGISVCLVNTEKGEKLIDNIKGECYLEERSISEAIDGNAQLRSPAIKNKEYDKFKKLYVVSGYKVARKKCLKKDKFKQKLKKLMRK